MTEVSPEKETEAVVTAISDNRLPEGFWSLEVFEGQNHIHDIHSALVDRLQQESPDADTLEIMMMERVCFLYIFMRAKESAEDTPNFDKTYKEMMQLWVSMAADLRKTRMRAEETSSIRLAVVSEVSRALKETLKGFDPAIAKKVQSQLVTLVAV